MQKKDNKVDEVKVCERGVEAGGETPSETVLFLRQRILYGERWGKDDSRNEPVAKVVLPRPTLAKHGMQETCKEK